MNRGNSCRTYARPERASAVGEARFCVLESEPNKSQDEKEVRMNGLEKHPTLTAVIQTDGGQTLGILVKAIVLAEDNQAYALVDEKGELRPANAEIKENNAVEILFFNAVWIEGDRVSTLDIITKEKKLHIGKLISLR